MLGTLGKSVYLVVKETHRLRNSVIELDIANLASYYFQRLITGPLLITWIRYLALLTSSMDLSIHIKHMC